jgi:hypothetical protein
MAAVFFDICKGPGCGRGFHPLDGIAAGSGGFCAVGYAGIAFIKVDAPDALAAQPNSEHRDDIILIRVWHVTVSVDIFCPCHCAFRRPGIPERENSGFVFPGAPIGSIVAGQWGIHTE